MNFKGIGTNRQIWILTTPLVVPVTDDPDKETSDQLMSRQEKFLKLSKGIKKKLSSINISQKIQAIGQKYGFELLHLANITRLIREYYFGEVRLENFPTEIEKRMGVSLLTAQEITRYLKQEIIDWDPWAEYIAKLPKMPIREIVAKHPKIAETEITDGYIELKGSDDLEDPSIKNWIKDYISHLGYDRHSQMDRTQYLFHSENGKNLSSQDREKLGIILKSFDENFPLPVDEGDGEIVFDAFMEHGAHNMEQKNPPLPQRPAQNVSHNEADGETKEDLRNNFIKPYAPIPARNATRSVADGSRPTLPPRPQPTSPPPSPYQGEGARPAPAPQPTQEFVHPNLATQPNRQASAEIDKYFSAHESPDVPAIKIHSITEHNEPRVAPQQNIQRPAPKTSPQPSPYQGEGAAAARPKYKIIDPFFSKPEPRLDGNIVDLSDREG